MTNTRSSRSSTRTSCTRSSPATRPRSRSTPILDASSRPTSTRSSGRSRRGSSMPPATCRGPASTRRRDSSRSSSSSAKRTAALPGRRRTRRFGDLHRASLARPHHPQGAAARVVVSRLRHHQAQHQPGTLRPVMRHWLARHRSQPTVRGSAALAVVALTLSAGCVLKKPPDAAALKEEALPGRDAAPSVDGGRGRRGPGGRQLARHVPRRAAERCRRRGDRPQRRPARRRRTRRAGAALRQAGGGQALSVGRLPRPRRRQDVGRRLGYSGRSA